MRGQNHLVVGAATVLLAQGATHFVHEHTVASLTLNSAVMLAPAVGLALLGALLPDIDLATSRIAYETGTGRGQGCLTGLVFHWIRKMLGGHRGLTHTLWAGAACAAVFGLQLGTFRLWGQTWPLGWAGLAPSWGVAPGWGDLGTAFTLGYLSHLAADMLTKEGVKFWYPFSHAEVGVGPRFLRFSTGSWVEFVWVLALVVAVVGMWFLGVWRG